MKEATSANQAIKHKLACDNDWIWQFFFFWMTVKEKGVFKKTKQKSLLHNSLRLWTDFITVYQKGVVAKVLVYDALPGTSYEILITPFSLHRNVQLDVKGMNPFYDKKTKRNPTLSKLAVIHLSSYRFDVVDRYCQSECEEDFHKYQPVT